jgi:hypothetical protein
MHRPWLTDPTGALGILLDTCETVADAVACLAYVIDAGQLLQYDGIASPGAFIGPDELAALFSFEFESRAGIDIVSRYAWHGETLGEHGDAILRDVRLASADTAWREKLAELGITIGQLRAVPQNELRPLAYGIDIGRDFS